MQSSISSTTCSFVAKCGKFFTIGKNAKFQIFRDTIQRTVMLFMGNIYIASCTDTDRVFGRPFVKRFALCYRSQTVVLSCLSVCDISVLWPNGWMDQNKKWRGDRPLPRPHCIRQPPICGPCLLWPNSRPCQLLLSCCHL